MRIISALSAVWLAAAPAAAQAPEAASARGLSSFAALSAFKFDAKSAAAPAVSGKVVRVSGEAKPEAQATQWVTLSGPITLNGSGFVSGNSGWVTVTLSGWCRLTDMSGKVQSENAYISTTASMMVNGGWVNSTVWPSAFVSVYKDGKFVGSTRVDGTVFVSGWANGGWVNVNGSGTLRGSLSVND